MLVDMLKTEGGGEIIFRIVLIFLMERHRGLLTQVTSGGIYKNTHISHNVLDKVDP